jgi:hypothetical protein
MAEQDGVGTKAHRLGYDGLHRHWTEFAVDQADLVAVIDQRSADREQTQRRQMVVRNPAADRGMRHVDQENPHARTLRR